jgi:hypothetical protein
MEEPAAKFEKVCREYWRHTPMFNLRPNWLWLLLRMPGE